MNKLVFEFSEEMMTIALLANGWTEGWKMNHERNQKLEKEKGR